MSYNLTVRFYEINQLYMFGVSEALAMALAQLLYLRKVSAELCARADKRIRKPMVRSLLAKIKRGY